MFKDWHTASYGDFVGSHIGDFLRAAADGGLDRVMVSVWWW
jgi:hypothetical protein